MPVREYTLMRNGVKWSVQVEGLAHALPEVGTPILSQVDHIAALVAKREEIEKEIDKARAALWDDVTELWEIEEIDSAARRVTGSMGRIVADDKALAAALRAIETLRSYCPSDARIESMPKGAREALHFALADIETARKGVVPA
jgi:hypothetical protein